ncbi:acetolactate synthase large subunit, partial [Francisella tularensis subsp. holarctica]|nr:acetolactate synthase large subunit [Francisella tularensis subsp. holarctica]
KVDIGINADAKEALNALLPYIARNSHPEWHQEFASEHEKEVRDIIKYETMPTDGEIKMAEVINLLSTATNGRALIVSDVGQHQMIAAR